MQTDRGNVSIPGIILFESFISGYCVALLHSAVGEWVRGEDEEIISSLAAMHLGLDKDDIQG